MNLTVGQIIAELAKLDPSMPVVMTRPSPAYPWIVTPVDTVKVEPAYDFDGYRNMGITLKAAFSPDYDVTKLPDAVAANTQQIAVCVLG